jgi:DNA-directed RNA polymerase specialized sigma24 family protein
MRDVRGHGGAASPVDATVQAASYEDFVATRGPALFRTAFLLAGSSADAQALLQAALVRLFPAWRRARRTGSAEAFATRVLLATFVAGRPPPRLLAEPLVTVPPDREPDPDPADRLALWPHLAALSPRQRVVVVLGYADGLGDHQIAELLGLPARVVATAGGTGLAALEEASARDPDDVRDRLEPELRQVAETRPLPDVAPDGLARAGAAERVRRRKGLLAATAAVVVLVFAAAVLPGLHSGKSHADRPTPLPRHPEALAQLAVGPDTTLPWWSHGELHVDHRVLPTTHDLVLFSGGTTLVGTLYVSGFDHVSAWWYVTPDGLVPLTSSTTTLLEPVVSPRGDLVALAQPPGASHPRLVLWSTAADRVLGTQRVPVHVSCCGAAGDRVIRAIDSQGRVLFGTTGPLRAWSPGHPVRRVRGIAATLYDVQAWPGGVTWQRRADDRGSAPVSYGILDAGGRLHVEGTTPGQSLWSPDGSRYAWLSSSSGPSDDSPPSDGPRDSPGDRLRVRHLLTGSTRTMRLPRRASYQLVGWESPTSVVVAVRRDTGRPLRGSDLPTQVQLLRCHADTGACETAGLAPKTILALSPYY